jgi:probable HAF family extracellular repeat protein
MTSKAPIYVPVVSLLAVLVAPAGLAAQKQPVERPRYVLVDLGTLGGPSSFFFSQPVMKSVSNQGIVVGGADTPVPDTFTPNNCMSPDCSILHAFQWQDGNLTDLGTLASGVNSTAYWVNAGGLIMGQSENGAIDPVTGLSEQRAVVWKHGQIIDLGTIEGGSFSFPNAMNKRGHVTGVAQNTISDSFSFLGLGTQSRAFLWRDGAMQDLGTLGGPDGWGASVNDRDQVAGFAYTDSVPNPVTNLPTQHPFLWESGVMRDLGTLGGTFAVVGSLQSPGAGASLNNRGQVIGTSNLIGDLTHHPFVWEAGHLTDLGTLGGQNAEAWWINEAGDIVGNADISGDSHNHHAFLWRRGALTDLGVPAGQPCSTAIQINSNAQIIVNTGICGVGGGPGCLWEDGVLYDLNNLIPPDSGFFIADVNFINDRGEIAVTGVLSNGDKHDLLLVPCDADHPELDCSDAGVHADVNATHHSRSLVTLQHALPRPLWFPR